jgi:ABC-type nickel/cobalt efflux system permease component RcnA
MDNRRWFLRVTPAFHAAVRRHHCNDAELPLSRLASLAIVVAAVVVGMSVCVASVMVSVLPFVLLFRDRDLGQVGSLAVALCIAPLSALVLGVVALLSLRVKTVVSTLVALSKPAPGHKWHRP